MKSRLYCFVLLLHLKGITCLKSKLGFDKPNIIVILADDLGVNDVSWNNRNAPTTNLQKLAEKGVILDNMYTLPICTPSRAALLTGVYPFRYGFQRGFGGYAPEGLPTDLSLLSEQLQDQGYNCSALGKWHLGFCSEEYLPTNRGFNYFSGLYVGDPVDILQIVNVLKKTDQYQNTVLLFLSDNGAKFDKKEEDFNYPLKGFKGTLYEGGTKIPAFIHSPLLDPAARGSRYGGLMHMVDIYPTLLGLTNTKIPSGLDGLDQWESITGQQALSPRISMVYNIDDSFLPVNLVSRVEANRFQIVVRDSQYKLIWGQINSIIKKSRVKNEFGLRFNKELKEVYDLVNDPSETNNLVNSRPDIVRRLEDLGLSHYKSVQPGLFRGQAANVQVLDPRHPQYI
ncbi:arylsulfatase I [Eurytemora carolleeae]|uniref:arylsulfatase I n=1 Tax=Eurytemora carolleeae TaxID=1294199 RepID=UPI000C76A88B|nr:arylsulfatase I [Eurytemora carolleeae]|eukprot:XP_023324509.1 arylsulfatase I-like [Eurytemora affinis]